MGGPLGAGTRSNLMDGGTLALRNNRPPGVAGAHLSTKEEIEHYAKSVMHRLHDAVGSDAVQKALFAVLGEQSFTAGVAYGMTKGLVVGVWQLGLLFKTLAFAEYDDLKHGGTFWERMRRGSALTNPMGLVLSADMVVASFFWPKIDQMAREAAQERDALFEAVKQAILHPGQTLSKAWDGAVKKYREYQAFVGQRTLSGNFQAGELFGEVLLDVLLIADGVTALARLATRVPELLRMLPKLEEIAPALRDAVQTSRTRLRGVDDAPPKAPAAAPKPAAAAPRVAPPAAPVAAPAAVAAPPAAAAVDYKTMSGPYELANGEERKVTFSQFQEHVQATGLQDAFTKPLDQVYDEVYAVPKAARPDPSTYLSSDFMDSHTEQFLGGSARVDTVASFDKYNKLNADAGLPFGRDDGVFMSPKSLIDDLYDTGDPSLMEKTLGFDPGTFADDGTMCRTVVSDPTQLGLRFATGQESGANPLWVPGGYTFKPGGAGVPEMLVDQLPSPLVDPNVQVFK